MLDKLGSETQVQRPVVGMNLWVGRVGLFIAVGVAYFLAARLGLALLTTAERVAVFWPASGIAVGILIALGAKARGPVAAGVIAATLAANLMGDRSVWGALAFGICNAGEALLAMWLIERWFGTAFDLGSLRRVLGFFAAAAVATATAAVAASGAMTLFGPSTAALLDVWEVWFASDALGIITVAPVLIGVAAAVRDAPSWREVIEGTLAVVAVTASIGFLLVLLSGPWSVIGPGAFLFPLLLWLGYRCRPVFAAAAAFTTAAAIVWTTTYEFGRYGDPTQATTIRIIAAQTAMLGVTLAALALSALFAERRRHEATIVASEARLQSILDAANVIAWDVDLTGDTVHSAGPVARLLNRPEGSAPRNFAAMVETIHPEDRDRVMAEFWAAVSTAATYNLEFRLNCDGLCWVAAEGSIERDAPGRPVRVRGITHDITEHKRAQAAAEESEARYRALYDDNPSMYFTLDASGTVLSVNEFGARQLGYTPAELVGQSVLEMIHEGDREEARRWLASCVENAGTISRAEMRKVRRDGSTLWVRKLARVVEGFGGQILLIVCEDITERREAELALAEREAQLGLAGKAARVGSFVIDYATGRIQTSPGFAAVHGLAEETEELTCDEWRDCVLPDDLARFEALRSQVFAEQRRELSMEYRVVGADGEARWIESRGLVSYDGDGRPTGLVGVHIDITERKRAEDQQCRLVAELDHRVKNVLATVQAVAAQTMRASSSMEHFVAAFDGRIRSMGSTHELLSRRRWADIPLTELVKRELAPYTTHNNTEIDGPDVMLSAEAAQSMAMVLHELVTNAAKYGALSTRDGRASVRWHLLRDGDADARLCFEWQETGGPIVQPSKRPGYGTEVIRGLLPYELGGKVGLAFASEGVRCRLDVPLSRLAGSDRLAGTLSEPLTNGQG